MTAGYYDLQSQPKPEAGSSILCATSCSGLELFTSPWVSGTRAAAR